MTGISPLEAENVNHLWTQLLFEEWRRLGLRRVIVCPGSRSSPLALAAVRTAGLEVHVAFDERCAGFMALGCAKVGGQPCAVVTTSGTAVANLLPSAVEARMSGVPILFVSADRPFELRACGANQTIEQDDLFGRQVRWSVQLPAPSPEVDPWIVLSTADEMWARAMAPPCGPVHLNASFREPLAPVRGPKCDVPQRIRVWWKSERPMRRESRIVQHSDAPDANAAVEGARRLLLIGGAGRDELGRVAEDLRSPLLADVACGSDALDVAVPAADLVLAALTDERCAKLRDRLRPDLVLRLGGPIVSRRVNDFAASTDRLIVERTIERHDERHAASVVVPIGWRPRAGPGGGPEFRDLWRRVGVAAAAAASGHFSGISDEEPLSEPIIAHELPRFAREGILVVGNSMPIRDVDAFRPREASVERIVANRGASGIDGLVSTAVGSALSGRPTTLLLGDLALLHDLGGLAYVRAAPAPLHVVVVNNDGGGIFHFLPIASAEGAAEHFERLFGTPHGFDFAGAAAMFGLAHRQVRTVGEARRAFALLPDAEGPTLVECMTDRRENVPFHRAVQRAVADALARAFA